MGVAILATMRIPLLICIRSSITAITFGRSASSSCVGWRSPSGVRRLPKGRPPPSMLRLVVSGSMTVWSPRRRYSGLRPRRLPPDPGRSPGSSASPRSPGRDRGIREQRRLAPPLLELGCRLGSRSDQRFTGGVHHPGWQRGASVFQTYPRSNRALHGSGLHREQIGDEDYRWQGD